MFGILPNTLRLAAPRADPFVRLAGVTPASAAKMAALPVVPAGANPRDRAPGAGQLGGSGRIPDVESLPPAHPPELFAVLFA